MNILFLLAAVLALFTSFLHAVVGERQIVAPLRIGADPRRFAVIDVAWHLITWHLVLTAVVLIGLAFRPIPLLAGILIVHWLGYAGLFLAVSIRRFQSWIALPQWTLFVALAVITAAGARPWPVAPGVGAVAAIVSGLVLAAIAGLHAYWVLGGHWPGHDAKSLTAVVLGGPPSARFPGAVATLTVVAALLCGAALVLGASGWISLAGLSPALIRIGAWGVSGVLLLRGVGGFFEVHLRPSIVGTPYARWSRVLYSPLCLGLSALVLLALIGG